MPEFVLDNPGEFMELAESPIEEVRSRDGFRARRRFKCAWSDRGSLRDQLLAFPGHQYPHANVVARCTSASATPFSAAIATQTVNDDHVITAPSHAIVEASYETIGLKSMLGQLNPNPSTPGAVEMISEMFEPTLEAMSLRDTPLKWNDGTPLSGSERPSWLMYGGHYSLTRHHLPNIPDALFDLLTGPTCNNSYYRAKLLNLEFAPETLSLILPRISMVADSTGQRKFTIEYRFGFKAGGWNVFPRHAVRADGSGGVVWQPATIELAGGPVAFRLWEPRNYDVL